MIHRDVEEALNLRRVQVERQMRSAPARSSSDATSFAEIGTRGLSLRSCRRVAVVG